VWWTLASILITSPAGATGFVGEEGLGPDWVPIGDVDLDDPAGIVAGWDADPGDWPDVAGIVDRHGQVQCTGTLIGPNLVLTAGHCADLAVGVVVNSTNYSQNGEWIVATHVVKHPSPLWTYDAALVARDGEVCAVDQIPISDAI